MPSRFENGYSARFLLNDAVVELAASYKARVVRPSANWYGFDPIHVLKEHRKKFWENFFPAEDRVASASPNQLSMCATDLPSKVAANATQPLRMATDHASTRGATARWNIRFALLKDTASRGAARVCGRGDRLRFAASCDVGLMPRATIVEHGMPVLNAFARHGRTPPKSISKPRRKSLRKKLLRRHKGSLPTARAGDSKPCSNVARRVAIDRQAATLGCQGTGSERSAMRGFSWLTFRQTDAWSRRVRSFASLGFAHHKFPFAQPMKWCEEGCARFIFHRGQLRAIDFCGCDHFAHVTTCS